MSNANQDTDHEMLKQQLYAVIKGIEQPDEDELNDDEPCTAMGFKLVKVA